MSVRPPAERLVNPDALEQLGDLAKLRFERRAVDDVFRACPTIALPGYSRLEARWCGFRDYWALIQASMCGTGSV